MTSDLLGFVSSLSGGDGMRVEETLGDGFVRLRISEAERRQAKHDIQCVEDAVIELLRNARDAGAHRIYVASSRDANIRTVAVIDNGNGIPTHLHERIFDARVTSKLDSMHMDKWGVHGRGMALYSIKVNALSAAVTYSEPGEGTCLRTKFDVDKIKERADQSTWPTLIEGTRGEKTLRGPRNIVRTCIEFALEARNSCVVYYGLPSEILATMRRHATHDAMSAKAWQNLSDDASHSLLKKVGAAQDARELAGVAKNLGFCMSERTAHRVVRGDIQPLRNVLAALGGQEERAPSAQGFVPTTRSISLTDSDRKMLASMASEALMDLASRYYIAPAGSPTIRVADGRIVISIPYGEDVL